MRPALLAACAAAVLSVTPAAAHAQLGTLIRRAAVAAVTQAATAAPTGASDAADSAEEARAAAHERYSMCVAAVLPTLGPPAPSTPESERASERVNALAMRMQSAAMRADNEQIRALQDSSLVATERLMRLQYPAVAKRCGPVPGSAPR